MYILMAVQPFRISIKVELDTNGHYMFGSLCLNALRYMHTSLILTLVEIVIYDRTTTHKGP